MVQLDQYEVEELVNKIKTFVDEDTGQITEREVGIIKSSVHLTLGLLYKLNEK